MLSVSYVGKNVYSANKTSGVLRGGYVLAHRALPPYKLVVLGGRTDKG